MDNPLEVLLNDKSLSVFKDFVLSKSMLNFYSNFYVKISDMSLGSPKDWGFHMDDPVKINLFSKKEFEGSIEDIHLSPSKDGSLIEVMGRTKTADMVDCEYNGTNREWKNQTLSSIVRNIADDFDVDISIDASVQSQAQTKITTYKVNEGQTAYENIQRICMPYGILPYSKGDGKLVLGRSTTIDRFIGGIERGSNILGYDIRLSNRNRYKKYIAKGLGIGDDSKSISDWTQCSGEFSDSKVSRSRTLTMFVDNVADKTSCKNFAKWMAWYRGGLSRLYLYTVPGWQTTKDETWDINKIVHVKDDWFDINEDMLIVDLDFFLAGGSSARTNLLLADKNIFSFSSKDVDVKSKVFDV